MDLGCLAPASRLKRAQAGKLSRDGKALLGIEIPCTSVSGLSEARWAVVGRGKQQDAPGPILVWAVTEGVFLQKHCLFPSD